MRAVGTPTGRTLSVVSARTQVRHATKHAQLVLQPVSASSEAASRRLTLARVRFALACLFCVHLDDS